MDFLKSRLGQNFTVCSLDEYKLNGFSKEWAAEQQPRKETMRVTQAATEFEFTAPAKMKALIGFDYEKELEVAAISMKVYINALAETKALALDKKDYFEKSRESWNAAIVDYLATKYRLDVLELRARKKMKNI